MRSNKAAALLLLAWFSANAVDVARPTAADLGRAVQAKPRPEYLGISGTHMSEVLNRHIVRFTGGRAVPCANISLAELTTLQESLFAARHDDLDAIYRSVDDPKALRWVLGDGDVNGTFSAQLENDLALVARRPDLATAIRDTKCRLTVMWFVHHLTEGSRAALLRAPSFHLPLLPFSTAEELGLVEPEDADSKLALKLYGDARTCMPCHIDGSEDPSPAPPPYDPTHEGPAFERWPDSVDYTLYTGMTGCCSPENNYTQLRKINRRWRHKQQLDVNYYVDCNTPMRPSFVNECKGGGFGPEDRTCMLDNCHNGQSEYAQYATCHFLYNGSDIWEWWPEEQRCTKLISGAGMPPPFGLTDSMARATYQGLEMMGDAPDVTKTRSCHKWCGSRGPKPCYWQQEDGAPCKQHFPNGIDFYGSAANGDWTVLDDDAGPVLTELPSYCPPQDTPALLTPSDPSPQQLVCTKWWFDSSMPPSRVALV